ncbi:MAG: class I SAM-dependent methyltransferase [Desulfarculaceae bacterium]|jgi:SAM-dependent methyltransferase
MIPEEQKEIFYKIFHASLPRLGPGDAKSTQKALDMVLSARAQTRQNPQPDKLRVLDLGCGNGAQTIQLAKHIKGTILALDNHQPFLDELQRRAEVKGVSGKIQTRLKDMGDMDFADETFDLIWSEGSLFVIGFGEGLNVCRSLLVPGGLLAASELCWLRPGAPQECQEYLTRVYPPVADINTNLTAIETSGYEILGHFTLPESSWWEPFYHPLEERIQSF